MSRPVRVLSLFLWTLLLVHLSVSLSVKQLCARRCLYGRGGILCNCNAMHFTGKRATLVQASLPSPEGHRGQHSHRGYTQGTRTMAGHGPEDTGDPDLFRGNHDVAASQHRPTNDVSTSQGSTRPHSRQAFHYVIGEKLRHSVQPSVTPSELDRYGSPYLYTEESVNDDKNNNEKMDENSAMDKSWKRELFRHYLSTLKPSLDTTYSSENSDDLGDDSNEGDLDSVSYYRLPHHMVRQNALEESSYSDKLRKTVAETVKSVMSQAMLHGDPLEPNTNDDVRRDDVMDRGKYISNKEQHLQRLRRALGQALYKRFSGVSEVSGEASHP